METQNEPMADKVTTRSVGIKYGIYLGAFGIIAFLIPAILDINVNDGPGAWIKGGVSFLVSIFIIYLAHNNFKENGDSFMSFGQGIGIGFWASLISTVGTVVFSYIYMKFVDANLITTILDKQREAMEAKGMSEEQIDQAMKYVAMFTTPEVIAAFSLFFGIVFGIIVALLVAIFTQKKNPDAIPN